MGEEKEGEKPRREKITLKKVGNTEYYYYLWRKSNEMGDNPTVVYAFLYNPMIHESGYVTMSLHETRKGAEIAMEFHRKEAQEEWEKQMTWREESCGDRGDLTEYKKRMREEYPFGQFQAWAIEPMLVLE
jgi:hypothetical protein